MSDEEQSTHAANEHGRQIMIENIVEGYSHYIECNIDRKTFFDSFRIQVWDDFHDGVYRTALERLEGLYPRFKFDLDKLTDWAVIRAESPHGNDENCEVQN